MKEKVTWWEPYGATLRTTIAETRPTGLLGASLWVRVYVISLVLLALMIGGAMTAFPGIALPWTHLVAGLILAPVMLAVVLSGVILAPCFVQVRRDWIQIQHGQSAARIKPSQIQSIEVVEDESGVRRLVVNYSLRRDSTRTRSCVIGTRVDLEKLRTLVAALNEAAAREAVH